MAKTTYTKSFKHDLEADANYLPILGSEVYRRFTIELGGTGTMALHGALEGSATKIDVRDIALGDDPSYQLVKDSAGNAVLSGLTAGLYSVELPTHLPGGVVLYITGATADDTVKVLMSGNAVLPGAPRGA